VYLNMEEPGPRPTDRARYVALGLIRSGRADRQERVGDLLRLERIGGGFYWLDISGRELRRGDTLADAEELQPTFLKAMHEIGQRAG
jgi:hypothetical protein